jgi:hypothetical protein
LHKGIYKDITVLQIYHRSVFVDDLKITGIGLVAGVDTIAKDSIVYISTEGETVGNSGIDHTNNTVNAINHLVNDYAGLSPTIATNGNEDHIGRTIVESQSLQELLEALCKQSFRCGFVGRSGIWNFIDWLLYAETGSETAFDFNSMNIVKDSISSFVTTPSSKIYNSFSCAYDFNYATDKYDKNMAILKPNVALPAITEAWDGYVSGIGTGSDATAYAEAQEAHLLVESGYNQTKQLRAYPSSESELSWFVDPSWVTGGTIAKTALHAWKYLKRCAYWLSAPRREVKFRVPLTYASIELLNYCSFSDPVYTQGEVLNGWITSISIDLEGIDLTMSMDRVADGNIIIETGSATTEIVETGAQPNDIVEG